MAPLRATARPAAPGDGAWTWRHRPVGRGLMTAATVLLAGPALLLDAAASAPGSALAAWHVLSTAALAGFGLWALWSEQLPRETGQRVARGVGLLLLGALAVAAQRVTAADARMWGASLAALMSVAVALFFMGAHWARREIHW